MAVVVEIPEMTTYPQGFNLFVFDHSCPTSQGNIRARFHLLGQIFAEFQSSKIVWFLICKQLVIRKRHQRKDQNKCKRTDVPHFSSFSNRLSRPCGASHRADRFTAPSRAGANGIQPEKRREPTFLSRHERDDTR